MGLQSGDRTLKEWWKFINVEFGMLALLSLLYRLKRISSRMDQSPRIFLCRVVTSSARKDFFVNLVFSLFLSLPFACTSRDIVYFYKAPGLIVISLPSLVHVFWM